MFRFLSICLLALFLMSCAATKAKYSGPARSSYLEQGKRYFEEGYYRRAIHELLPLAADNEPEAQYAVGYMYYYGYGVAQDTDVGYFWIKRSASHHYELAVKAKLAIEKNSEQTQESMLNRRLYPERLR